MRFKGRPRQLDALLLSSIDERFELSEIVNMLSSYSLDVHIVPLLVERSGYFNFLVRVEGSPFFTIQGSSLARSSMILKRAFDLIFSISVVMLISPLLLLLSVIMLVSQGRPLLYKSRRVGFEGNEFAFYKFRSMVKNAEEMKSIVSNKHSSDHVLFKSDSDPRITPIGRIMRRFSLDELPQFLNVIKGDMSVVGPRPALPEEVERYSTIARRRLNIKPGVTGPWQVSGRADLTWNKSLLLDLNYSIKWNPWGDLWIICRTVGVMVTGKGAY